MLSVHTISKLAKAGFKNYAKTGIVINVAATVRADVDFQVGSANESVTVNATALAVQTETNEVS